jgi:hypothetical protein
MFHGLSIKAMAKAFTKVEEIIQKSLGACQSDKAWNEDSEKHFKRCNEELKKSNPWIGEIYHDVEKISAHEGDPEKIFLNMLKFVLKHVVKKIPKLFVPIFL